MTDAVKMAIEALRWIVEREKSASSAAALEMARAATDAHDKIAALEQAGEPVDVALLDRAELAWQRFFYPAADCFTGPVGDKLPSVDLEVADCLRLVLASVGRLVVTPDADVPAPLPTLQRLGQEFDAGEELSTLLTKAIGDITVALTWAGKSGKIEEWTAPYVAAVNQFDAQTQSRVAAEPVGLREADQ